MSKDVHHLRATQYGGKGELSIMRTDTFKPDLMAYAGDGCGRLAGDRLAAGTQPPVR